jgi:hypothetical protein
MEINQKDLTLKISGRKLGSSVHLPGVLRQKRRKTNGRKIRYLCNTCDT